MKHEFEKHKVGKKSKKHSKTTEVLPKSMFGKSLSKKGGGGKKGSK